MKDAALVGNEGGKTKRGGFTKKGGTGARGKKFVAVIIKPSHEPNLESTAGKSDVDERLQGCACTKPRRGERIRVPGFNRKGAL